MILEYADGRRICPRCGQSASHVGGRIWRCTNDYCRRSARPLVKAVPSPPQAGPGTELKKLLKRWLGFTSAVGCKCNATAHKMNARGPDWCEGEGMPEILAAMQAEHAKRWAAGKTILPWVEAGARRLVLLACKRARANA